MSFIQRTGAILLDLGVSKSYVDMLLRGDGWRLMMIAGALPALLVFFVRLLVPESSKWKTAHQQGATSFWATRDLIGVLIGCLGASAMIVLWSPTFKAYVGMPSIEHQTTIVMPMWALGLQLIGTAVGLVVALLGYMFPVVRYLGRATKVGSLRSGDRGLYSRRLILGALLASVPLLGTWGSLQWAPKWAIALSRQLPVETGPYFAKEYTQIASAIGAIIGTILAALAGGLFGRRITYVVLCIGSFASLVYMYQANQTYGSQLLASVFVAGGFTAAFYGWFPLYFPELFPTSIRATSQGFAYNFGRILSAIGSLQTATLTAYFAQGIRADRIDIDAFPKAGAALAGIYLVGVILIWFGPEIKGNPLPD